MPQATIREFCEDQIRAQIRDDRTDEEILRAVHAQFQFAFTTFQSLRKYRTQMRARGIEVPPRPRGPNRAE